MDKGGGQVQVPKSRDDISVECAAPGYEKQTMNIESSASGWGVVGCFLIDLCITDYSTGALNKYPKTISVKLKQLANAAPPAPRVATTQSPTAADPPGQPQVWHVIGSNVQAYTDTGWVPVPESAPLALVQKNGDQGLFLFPNSDGSYRQGWIGMGSVTQQQ
jgi:hypothetical protein